MKLDFVWQRIKSYWEQLTSIPKARAVNTLEWEASELEHVFAIITLGALIGLPAPPMQITFELLPDMEKELSLLISKIDTSGAPLSELFSTLDVN